MIRYFNQLKQSHLVLAEDARRVVEHNTVGGNIPVMLVAAIVALFALSLPYVGESVSTLTCGVFVAAFVRMFALMAFYAHCDRVRDAQS